MARNYDFAIVGAGVFGAWTAHYLRGRGARVALLDAYGPANSRASSSGETRAIRMGYGSDELYTRWSARSLPQWQEFGSRIHQPIFQRTGVLWLSNDADTYTRQLFTILVKNGIHCEELSANQIRTRYPQFVFPDVTWGVLEPESGLLLARQAVQELVKEDVKNGMEFIPSAVLPPGSSVSKLDAVRTSAGDSVAAGVFIFACGPWLPKLFPNLLSGQILPTRQEIFFLGPPAGSDSFRSPRMPVWLHRTHPDLPYALPDVANRGFKIAFDRHGPEFDPDSGERVVAEDSVARLRSYLRTHVPVLVDAPIVETRVCQYENTLNGDFLIDCHPELENVWIVGGGSGHGFKHGPAVGEYVSGRIFGDVTAEPRFSLVKTHAIRRREVF